MISEDVCSEGTKHKGGEQTEINMEVFHSGCVEAILEELDKGRYTRK